MGMYFPEKLGFIDEASKDCRSIGRRFGRSVKNQRAKKKQPFVRGCRVSATGLLTLDGVVAQTMVEGSMTKDLFLAFLEHMVVSALLSEAQAFLKTTLPSLPIVPLIQVPVVCWFLTMRVSTMETSNNSRTAASISSKSTSFDTNKTHASVPTSLQIETAVKSPTWKIWNVLKFCVDPGLIDKVNSAVPTHLSTSIHDNSDSN